MSEAVDAYQEAVRDFNGKNDLVQRKVLEPIQDAHLKFNRAWYRVYPSSSPSKYKFPIDIAGSGSTIDLSGWPSADDIARLISEWHWARNEVTKKWNAIPEGDRAGLQAPGDYRV